LAQEIEDSVETTDSAAEAASDTQTTDAPSVEETTADAGATEAAADSAADGDAGASADESLAGNESAPAETSQTGEDRPVRVTSSQPELADALTSAGGEQDGPRKEVEGGRAYEIIYIARIGDDARNAEIVERVRALIDGKDGAVDNVRSTETRRLSYPINGETDGIYYVVNARFTPEHMGEIDRFFKLEEDVIRHMILREDV
jgi:small subunit ribosomal protein S6